MESKIKLISLLLVIVILFTGCADMQKKLQEVVKDVDTEQEEEEVTDLEPEYGGEVILPLSNVKTLNPITNRSKSYFYFAQLIYEGLFEFDEFLAPKEKLASEYSIQDEGRVINVKLRDDVYWHDGERFTAEDVVFTLDVIKSSGRNSVYGDMLTNAFSLYTDVNLGNVIDVEGSGDSLIFKFSNAYSNNLESLTFPIIPKHVFSSVRDGLRDEDYPLVGTGPFKLENYTKLKELSLVRNDEYWDGKAYLDKVKGRIYSSDNDIERAFEIGQVNMMVTEEADWDKYGTTDRMKVLEYASPNYDFLGFNFNKEIFLDESGKNLRKAIAYGIDREKIIENIYLGHATETDVPLNPYSWQHQGNLSKYSYDVKLANDYMTKTKLGNKGESGYILDEHGNRLSLTLLTNTLDMKRYETAELIKQDLKEIGIEVIIEPEDRITNLTDDKKREDQYNVLERKIAIGDYDIALLGWEFSPIENLGYIFHSQNRGRDNFINFTNENMDRMIEDLLVSGGNRDLKRKKTEELSDIILEELPYVSLFYKNEGLLIDKNLHGELKPVMLNPYRGMKDVFKVSE